MERHEPGYSPLQEPAVTSPIDNLVHVYEGDHIAGDRKEHVNEEEVGIRRSDDALPNRSTIDFYPEMEEDDTGRRDEAQAVEMKKRLRLGL
jgi:hypothetical protein